ncbi:MAG: helix-turn-helix domain-containing protein [bacterium]|nr:helix-turn-helix domain-containing protein [bacterium]
MRHRLAVLRHAEEVTGSVAATCRYYGISQTVFYKWRNRYEELGEEAGEVHGLHVEVCSHVHEENYAFPC